MGTSLTVDLPGHDQPGGPRQVAWELLRAWTENENLRKHALGVELAMRAYAQKFGEDEERWAVVGLLHDLDYERHPTPDKHPQVGVAELARLGYPADVQRAILGHADYLQVDRDTLMAKALYAVDELSGFVTAVALVRPSKRLADVEVKSVKKKLKDKAFARGCNRDEIARGARELGVDFDEHIGFVLAAMQEGAEVLGL